MSIQHRYLLSICMYMVRSCIGHGTIAGILSIFARCIYEKDICLLCSVCMHVQGIYMTGHYVVVNTECVCR